VIVQDYYDEILPNFVERKHPRKREKRKQGARTKVPRQANSPKEAGDKEVVEPLISEFLEIIRQLSQNLPRDARHSGYIRKLKKKTLVAHVSPQWSA
jgi:hypothetical protein